MVFAVILLLLFVSSEAGHIIGKWQINKRNLGVLKIAEGSVFAILGLLVAFSFAGAYERFEARKIQIIQEANAIDSAYLRLDLLPDLSTALLRKEFHDYVQLRLAIYTDLNLTNFAVLDQREEQLRQLQLKIWQQAIVILKSINSDSAYQLVVPALNTMFEASNTQYEMSKVHPPRAIFALLLGLTVLSAFLTGYRTVRKRFKNYTYIVSYLLVTTFILYVIFDLELPRLGLIRVTYFDQDAMQKLTDLIGHENKKPANITGL